MDRRRIIASAEEKSRAGSVLREIFFGNDNGDNHGLWLHDHLALRLPGVEKIIASDREPGASEILDELLPDTLVEMFGSELFEGDPGRKLREKILDILLEDGEYRTIFDIFCKSVHRNEDESGRLLKEFKNGQKEKAEECSKMLKTPKKYPWRPGGTYARSFVQYLKLPDIFAGIRSDPAPERIEEAVPKADIKELKSFQANMKLQIVKILNGSEDKRAIVTLPTGAGKTRIVVEAIVDFLNSRPSKRRILWIAQSQEVCEQAVLCFKQIWEQYGSGETLEIFRAWGKNDLPTSDELGVIVGGVQKLVSKKHELCELADDGLLSGVFIDEAHHSVADSYGEVLRHLHMSTYQDGGARNDDVPLIGLTATPERREDNETEKLLRMYGRKRIYPSDRVQPASERNGPEFDERWSDLGHMKRELVKLKYLAHAKFIPVDPGMKYFRLDKEETKDFDEGGDVWMKRIATEPERNSNIKNEIIQEAKKGRKILYFGTNVAQSNAMSRILERNGFKSVCITGDTRYAARRLYVDMFNEPNGDIQIMCNYNVLSTGFDSPQIDTVIIARPTTSIVAYQQMVGRGLRGEEFGGKEGNECRIITVRDNIRKFNDDAVELGYEKFEKDVWNTDENDDAGPQVC